MDISDDTIKLALRVRSAVSEKRMALMRFVQSLLLPGIYWVYMDKTGTDTSLALLVTISTILFSIFVLVYKPYKVSGPVAFSNLASIIDTLIIFLWIYATGGKDSDFDILMFISLLAIAFKSGKKYTLIAGLCYTTFWGLVYYFDDGFPYEISNFVLDAVFLFITTGIGMIISREFTKQTRNILANQELTEDLKKNNKYLRLLQVTSDAFNYTSSVSEAGEECIETICQELDWQIGHLCFAEKSNTIQSSGIWNHDARASFKEFVNATNKIDRTTGISLKDLVLQKEGPVLIRELKDKIGPGEKLFELYNLESAIAFPVYIKNEIVAVFEFFATEKMEENPDLLNILGQVGVNFGRVIERIRAENLLKQKNEEIKRIFSNAPDAIVIMDFNGKVVNWNPEAEKQFGWSVDDAIGAFVHKLIIPERYRQAHLNGLEHFKKTGEGPVINNTIEIEAQRKDGTEFFVELSISSPVKANGSSQFIGFIRDITERKKARSTEALLASIVKYSNDAIISKNLDSQVLSWNPGAQRMFGYSADEIIGKNILMLTPKERQDEESFIMDKIKNGQSVEHYETNRRRKDGSIIDVSLTISPIRDESGKIQGASSIARDITLKKENEEALEKFRYALNNSADSIFITNRERMLFEDVNESACISTGYSRKELLNLGPADIMPEYGAKELEALFNEISSSPSNFGKIQTVNRRKDGSLYNVEILFKSFEYNEKSYLVAAVRDITERLEAENKLEEANLFLNSILENLPVMVFVKSATDLSFVSINKACEEITGISKSEIIGKSDYDFFPEEEAGFFVSKDREVLESGKVMEIPEEIIESRNQGKRWLYTVKVPIMDADGKPKYLLGISEDITDKREAFNRINKLNYELTRNIVQLEEVNKELESFTYSVSHDLRAPLRAINGYTQILSEDYEKELNDNGKRMLHEVQKSSLKMGNLIEDLLAFSRLGRKKVTKDKVEMEPLVRQVIEEIENSFGRKINIKLKNLLPVKADANLLKQVLLNLLSNAAKYSSKNLDQYIEIGSYKKGNTVEYYVKDNGVGFDMAYADKLFQVFQRLHSDSEFEGTGVGLAIVSKIINKHGGKTWAYSEPDKGAIFYFSLPED